MSKSSLKNPLSQDETFASLIEGFIPCRITRHINPDTIAKRVHGDGLIMRPDLDRPDVISRGRFGKLLAESQNETTKRCAKQIAKRNTKHMADRLNGKLSGLVGSQNDTDDDRLLEFLGVS